MAIAFLLTAALVLVDTTKCKHWLYQDMRKSHIIWKHGDKFHDEKQCTSPGCLLLKRLYFIL